MTRWYVTTQKASVLLGRDRFRYERARLGVPETVEFRGRPAILSHDGVRFSVITLGTQPCRHGANSAAV